VDPNYRYFASQKVKLEKRRTKLLELKKEQEKVIKESAREMVAGADLI